MLLPGRRKPWAPALRCGTRRLCPSVSLLNGLVGVLEEEGDLTAPAGCAAYWGDAHDGPKGHLVGLREVMVPKDVHANVRLWQAEVRAAGLAGLYLLEVARLDIVYPSRRGMLWQELQVTLEMGPLVGVVSDLVAVVLEPHSAHI